ncbi:MAG TPA: hypothetical protein VH500_20870 [Nitrososphaeraceae archaeon]
MKKKTLVYNKEKGFMTKEIIIYDNVDQLRIISNPTAWKIMQLLSSRSMYTAQVAKELGIYEQSAYYYTRKLNAIGALDDVGTALIRGGTAKLFRSTCPSFGIEMDWGERQSDITIDHDNRNHYIKDFFNEFITEDSFDGLIVVGAPDPHGPYRSSARDGHYAVQLAFFLGTLTNIPREFVVKLDADAKAERVLEDRNIISIGGPGTNIVTAEFNKYLPIKFNESNFWAGLVRNSNEIYNSDSQGLIAKIKNPYSDRGSIIVVAGVRSIGTKSAVIALTNFSEQILKSYRSEKDWALVVQGFDMNSDGKIDHVDVIAEK